MKKKNKGIKCLICGNGLETHNLTITRKVEGTGKDRKILPSISTAKLYCTKCDSTITITTTIPITPKFEGTTSDNISSLMYNYKGDV